MVLKCVNWTADTPSGLAAPDGSRFFVLRALSKKDRFKAEKKLIGYEAELELPEGTTGQSCLLFEAIDPKQEFSTDVPRFIHDAKDRVFTLNYSDNILLKPDVDYELSFFVKGTGFTDLEVNLRGLSAATLVKVGKEERYENEALAAITQTDFGLPSSWSQVKKKVRFTKTKGDKKEGEEFSLYFKFVGDGSFYLDDIVLIEKPK